MEVAGGNQTDQFITDRKGGRQTTSRTGTHTDGLFAIQVFLSRRLTESGRMLESLQSEHADVGRPGI